MTKNIDQEIEKLLKIKAEVDKIKEIKKIVSNCEIVSQLMHDFLATNNLLNPNVFYYITTNEIGQYVEGFRG